MAIEHIDPTEFPTNRKDRSEESEALLKLEPGQAFKVLCRWKHHKTNTTGSFACSGGVMLRTFAKRHNIKIKTACQDKWVYVKRIAG